MCQIVSDSSTRVYVPTAYRLHCSHASRAQHVVVATRFDRTLRVLSASVAASASYTIRTCRVLSASAAASYTVLHCSHASRAQGSAAPQRFSVTQKDTSQVPLLYKERDTHTHTHTHRHTSQVPLFYK